MSLPSDRDPSEKPLSERDDRVGELLRQANGEFRDNIDTRRAFLELDARLERRKRASARVPMWAYALPVLVLGVFYASLGPRDGSLSAGLRLEPEAQSPRVAPVVEAPAPVDERTRLADGHTQLPDGSSMRVTARSRVRWHSTVGGIRVQLDAGEVQCAVKKQEADKRFVVDAGGYTFVVLGDSFKLQHGKEGPRVDVYGGRVEVRRGAQRVAMVNKGGSWSAPLAHENAEPRVEASNVPMAPVAEAPVSERSESKTAPAPARDCGALVKAQTFRDAATCYQEQSLAGGLTAEFALFELARLRLSALNDAAGAVSALEEHQRRFADGALSHQVALALTRARSAADRPVDARGAPGRSGHPTPGHAVQPLTTKSPERTP